MGNYKQNIQNLYVKFIINFTCTLKYQKLPIYWMVSIDGIGKHKPTTLFEENHW